MIALRALLRWVRRFATLLVFLVMFAFYVSSHMVGALSLATSTVISTLTGTSTVVQNLQSKERAAVAAVRASNNRLTALEAENRRLRTPDTIDFRGKKTSPKEASSVVLKSLQSRTKLVAAANAGSAVGESIPVYGIAIIAAATTYELKSACENMKELHELDVALNPETADLGDRDYVCGLKVPTKEELWQMVKNSPKTAWKSAVSGYEGVSEWATNLEAPDFSGSFSRLMAWTASWFE